ncbi:nucleoporin 155 [Heterostelium album PN500]|uniref:Nucleoporin 155 n=1 Tax=Heterostelium pallidum (strain ATCC 26659 / Pp 5 / PN500) TaxID=670386 RepID=D3BF12_HETP5|nr:nucleoporin 155 [Heterostelium album PN500]EFA80493.1 nucleoporin 155 [Heterostelium album PN500]|eukprot:XP_020432613.1 nucleoporin 155 [Heterostelium album PN500]
MNNIPMSMSQLNASSLYSQHQQQQYQQQYYQQSQQQQQPQQQYYQQSQQQVYGDESTSTTPNTSSRYYYNVTPSPATPLSAVGSLVIPRSVITPTSPSPSLPLPQPHSTTTTTNFGNSSLGSGESPMMMIDQQPYHMIDPTTSQHHQQYQFQQTTQPLNKQSTAATTSVSNNLASFSKEQEWQYIFKNAVSMIDESIANLDTLVDPTKTLDSTPITGYNYFESANPVWSTLLLEKHIQFPQEITQRYLTANTKTLQGIFPEIGKAWISIDQTLFLWDYRDGINGGELITNHLSQIITACGLVVPRRNVFKDTVKYLLVVSTHVEIFLFALSFQNNDEQKVELITTPLVIPTDSVIINDIVGTDEGRIFVGGQDGNLYEIVYNDGQSSWFRTSKISKINHTTSIWNSIWASKKAEIIQILYDSQRRMIFTLDKNSVINRYYLGATNKNALIHEQPLTPLARYNTESRLSIISINLSSQVDYQLIAICSNGVRLYISQNSGHLKYARKPPITGTEPHYSFYCNGVYFVAIESSELMDKLIGTTPFSRKMIKRLYEADNQGFITSSNEDPLEERPNQINIKGRVNVIKEDIVNVATGTSSTSSIVFYKEFKYEHATIPRRFLCLNSLGLHIITKLRYVDLLRNLLSLGNLIDIDTFYNEFGAIYSNSLCIAICCETPQSAPLLTEQFYGALSAPKSASQRLVDLAMTQFKRRAGKPSYLQAKAIFSQDMGTSVNQSEIVYSNAHNAVVAYISRVLSPIWSEVLIDASNSHCPWSAIQLKTIQSHLVNLLLFLENSNLVQKNESDIPISKKPINEQSTDEDALKNEKRNLLGIKKLIQKSLQVINLFLILLQFNFQQIFEGMEGLSHDDKQKMYQFKFKDYVQNQTDLSPSKNVPSLLIVSCMKLLNSLNIQIDNVTRQLEYECPDIFKKTDKQLIVAKDKLKNAIRDGKSHYTDQLVKDALMILDEISPKFDLNEIIGYLVAIQYFEYIVPLALTYASRLDPNNLTQNQNNKQSSDPSKANEAKEKEELKKKALFEIFKVIDLIINDQDDFASKEFIDYMINQILASNDRICHEMLYSWLLTNNLVDKLFDIKSPYITEFLYENDIELCWKQLAKNSQFEDAAKILIEIAEKSKLLDKIKCYTNCALVLSELKENEIYLFAKRQLVFCQIQKKIVNQLSNLLENNSVAPEQKKEIKQSLDNLNDNIYDITTLFTEYARKYLLHEEMLYLVHIGNHDDQQFVKLLWKIIIEKEAQERYSDVNQLVEALKTKIVNIGYDLYPNDSTFPLQSIVNIAEKTVFVYGEQTQTSVDDALWLIRPLHDQVKIDYWTLLDQYREIIEDQNTSIESNEPTWRTNTERDYLISIFITLIETMLKLFPPQSVERHVFNTKRINYTLRQLKDKVSSQLKSRIDNLIKILN